MAPFSCNAASRKPSTLIDRLSVPAPTCLGLFPSFRPASGGFGIGFFIRYLSLCGNWFGVLSRDRYLPFGSLGETLIVTLLSH